MKNQYLRTVADWKQNSAAAKDNFGMKPKNCRKAKRRDRKALRKVAEGHIQYDLECSGY